MARFSDLPHEIRLQIYHLLIDDGVGIRGRVFGVTDRGFYDVEQIKFTEAVSRFRYHFAPMYGMGYDGLRGKTKFPSMLSSLARVNRRTHEEVTSEFYGRFEFLLCISMHVVDVPMDKMFFIACPLDLGWLDNQRDRAGEVPLGVLHRDPWVHIARLNNEWLAQVKKLTIMVADDFRTGSTRRTVAQRLEELVGKMQRAGTQLNTLCVEFEAAPRPPRYRKHTIRSPDAPRFEYALEPLHALRAASVSVRGGTSPEFAAKLEHVMMGGHPQGLREVDYGSRTVVRKGVSGRKRMRQMEVNKRMYFQPRYDWDAVETSTCRRTSVEASSARARADISE